MSAGDRCAGRSVIRAAIAEFALAGRYGTALRGVAHRVGATQPYLFRLFPDKWAIFAVVLTEARKARTRLAFEGAAAGVEGVSRPSARQLRLRETVRLPPGCRCPRDRGLPRLRHARRHSYGHRVCLRLLWKQGREAVGLLRLPERGVNPGNASVTGPARRECVRACLPHRAGWPPWER
ncbi:TetR family transcriptional regulator [Streptomyces sp. PSKA28]|uniref:TetR family transcriptional regulator n=1 Tax=Streptomyces himalayensis subsp. himalayensis TaxID=2756131 RepID=A0A7W0ID14_9ACTN|nr:TetR family transcriptional regulator [Streptomyces himalayensis subsp. himalayensis]